MLALLEAYCADPPKPIPSIEALCEQLAPSVEPSTTEMSMEPPRLGRTYRLTVWFAKDCLMRSAGAFLVRQRLSKLGRVLRSIPDPESPEIETTPQWVIELEAEGGKDEIRKAARVPGVTTRVVLREEKLAPPAPVGPARSDHEEEGASVRTAPKARAASSPISSASKSARSIAS